MTLYRLTLQEIPDCCWEELTVNFMRLFLCTLCRVMCHVPPDCINVNVRSLVVVFWSAVQLPVGWNPFPGEYCVRFLLWCGVCCGLARLRIVHRSSALTFDEGRSPNPPAQMVHLIHSPYFPLPGDSQEPGPM